MADVLLSAVRQLVREELDRVPENTEATGTPSESAPMAPDPKEVIPCV